MYQLTSVYLLVYILGKPKHVAESSHLCSIIRDVCQQIIESFDWFFTAVKTTLSSYYITLDITRIDVK